MTKSNRKATSATSSKAHANQPRQLTAVDKAVAAIVAASKATQPGNIPTTDEQRRAAVLTVTNLASGQVTDTMREFVKANAHLVRESSTSAAVNATKAEDAFKVAEKTLADRKAARAEAIKLAKARTADEVRFVHRSVTVHKIFTQRELMDLWELRQSQASNIGRAGKMADKLGVLGNNEAVGFLLTNISKNSKTLTSAVDKPGATLTTVREAITGATAAKASKPSESLSVQAHKDVAKVINDLRVLMANGHQVADIGDVKGTALVGELHTQLALYARKYDIAGLPLVIDGPTDDELADIEQANA